MSRFISVYMASASVEEADAIAAALLARTEVRLFGPLAARVRALHGYETPCIVAWLIEAGDAAYLEWIGAETGNS